MDEFNSRKTEDSGHPNYVGRPDHWAAMSRDYHYPSAARQQRRYHPKEPVMTQDVRAPPLAETTQPPATTRPARQRPTKDSAPKDGPLYELPDMVSLIPDERYHYVNLDHAGFIAVLESSYAHMRAQDSRLDRYLPFSVYQPSMVEVLWCHLLSLADATNQETDLDPVRQRRLLNIDSAV